MLKTHNKNFIFGLERRKFKSYIGLPLFSLFIFFFLVSFTSGESYADCSVYGTCQETQTDVSFAGGGSGSGGITTEVDPLSIHNNTYAGYYALLDKLGVANYVGYNLGASGFDSVWGARDGSQCNGNYFDSCSGDATPCSSFLIDSECQMQTGCYYDYDLSQCAGTSQSCDTFSSASSCQQQQGCTANTPSCNVFTDQTSCETKPGECSWDLIPETYDLQYKTQSFFNFSRPIHATQVNFKTQSGEA